MARPNITINNIDYPTVPKIIVPKTGGGTAEYYDRSGALDFIGAEIENLGEIYSAEYTLAETSFATWSPSTTAATIISSKNLTTKPVLDMVNYEYALRWKFTFSPVYDGTETNTARVVKCVMNFYQLIQKRANSLANIGAKNYAGNACATLTSAAILEYWNNNSSHTYTWSASYGIYAAATAATFSNGTSNTPTLTIKTPSVSARCSTTYLSTSNAGKLDQSESVITLVGEFFRYKPTGILWNEYNELCDLYNTI